MIVQTTYAELSHAIRAVRGRRALEADGQPPADAILPGPDGLIYHKPFDDAAANAAYERDYWMASLANLQMKRRPALGPTRYRRWVEPVRVRQARWLREAEQEVEAYLG